MAKSGVKAGDGSPPVLKGHGTLIKFMQIFGYKANSGGICFGLSQMAIQAMLYDPNTDPNNKGLAPPFPDPMEVFNKRLLRILEIYKELGEVGLKELVRIYQLEASKRPTNLTAEQINILAELPDLLSFLDGIELYYAPEKFPHLFEEGTQFENANQAKNAVIVRELLSPVTIEKVGSVTGSYDEQDLQYYFASLNDLKKEGQKIAFDVSANNHSISFGYDGSQWWFVDANQLPPKKIIAENPGDFKGKFEAAFRGGLPVQMYTLCYGEKGKNLQSVFNPWVKNLNEHNRRTIGSKYKNEKEAWLLMAADKGDLASVKLIVSEGVTEARNDVTTPLCSAATNNNIAMLQTLIDGGADLNAIQNKFMKNTALHIAVENGSKDVVNALITAGANLDILNSSENTPLHIAIEKNDIELVKVLIAGGANLDVNGEGLFKTPILHAAIKKGNKEIVRALIAGGADLEIKKGFEGTPLHCAIASGQVEIVEELIKAGASLESKGFKDNTPLQYAELLDQLHKKNPDEENFPEVPELMIKVLKNPPKPQQTKRQKIKPAAKKIFKHAEAKVVDNSKAAAELIADSNARLASLGEIGKLVTIEVNSDNEFKVKITNVEPMKHFIQYAASSLKNSSGGYGGVGHEDDKVIMRFNELSFHIFMLSLTEYAKKHQATLGPKVETLAQQQQQKERAEKERAEKEQREKDAKVKAKQHEQSKSPVAVTASPKIKDQHTERKLDDFRKVLPKPGTITGCSRIFVSPIGNDVVYEFSSKEALNDALKQFNQKFNEANSIIGENLPTPRILVDQETNKIRIDVLELEKYTDIHHEALKRISFQKYLAKDKPLISPDEFVETLNNLLVRAQGILEHIRANQNKLSHKEIYAARCEMQHINDQIRGHFAIADERHYIYRDDFDKYYETDLIKDIYTKLWHSLTKNGMNVDPESNKIYKAKNKSVEQIINLFNEIKEIEKQKYPNEIINEYGQGWPNPLPDSSKMIYNETQIKNLISNAHKMCDQLFDRYGNEYLQYRKSDEFRNNNDINKADPAYGFIPFIRDMTKGGRDFIKNYDFEEYITAKFDKAFEERFNLNVAHKDDTNKDWRSAGSSKTVKNPKGSKSDADPSSNLTRTPLGSETQNNIQKSQDAILNQKSYYTPLQSKLNQTNANQSNVIVMKSQGVAPDKIINKLQAQAHDVEHDENTGNIKGKLDKNTEINKALGQGNQCQSFTLNAKNQDLELHFEDKQTMRVVGSGIDVVYKKSPDQKSDIPSDIKRAIVLAIMNREDGEGVELIFGKKAMEYITSNPGIVNESIKDIDPKKLEGVEFCGQPIKNYIKYDIPEQSLLDANKM